MKLVVGLGNPGGQYHANRHNIGFMAADAIHRRNSFGPWSKKFRAEIAEGEIGGEKILLLKPQTFMNLSGDSVGEAMRFFKLQPGDIIVLHDELDLPAGKVRVKTGGGHGGHNGLKSIDAHCGREYRRVRLGIGHPGNKDLVHNHVLGDFSKADKSWLEPLLDDIAGNVARMLEPDPQAFIQSLSGNQPAPKAAKPEKAPAVGQSHIRQARNTAPVLPASGPMAEMLKKLLGKN